MVIFNGNVVVWPSVQLVHGGASIETPTTCRSFEVQGFRVEISHLRSEFLIVCANVAPEKNRESIRSVSVKK